MEADVIGGELGDVQARAQRFHKLASLVCDAELSSQLSRIARQLEEAGLDLSNAQQALRRARSQSHDFWNGLDVKALTADPPGQPAAQTADALREVVKLCIDEAGGNHDAEYKGLVAGRAYEIAQVAESLDRKS